MNPMNSSNFHNNRNHHHHPKNEMKKIDTIHDIDKVFKNYDKGEGSAQVKTIKLIMFIIIDIV